VAWPTTGIDLTSIGRPRQIIVDVHEYVTDVFLSEKPKRNPWRSRPT